MSRRIGLIAGWGRYPVTIARRLHERGDQVYCLGIVEHADPVLKDICHSYRTIGVARVSGQIRHFQRNEVSCATMAGKIFKSALFSRTAWIKHMPDLGFLRYYYSHFLTKTNDRKDDTLLSTFVNAYADHGIELAPATNFAPELLVDNRLLSKRKPTASELKDIRFCWELAKKMGGLDVGQSVAVKGRAVLAVEAVEGTDECIRRAGGLCPAGGFTVVKVAKPEQDMRFDVPTIGLGTLKTLKEAGGKVLAVESNKTILLDEPEVIEYANRYGLSVLFTEPQNFEQVPKAA